ncbi:hypothetical protein IWQ62_000735 [Dispira parvispora]|uniref:Uncharacterized protein n=1 Tax=Dispira parvispora TaxID=1520584 RepID=A0A9W8AWG5_9FUNG|nr:hypothetical protein IWQ62_000735 [Dispira parvispora]
MTNIVNPQEPTVSPNTPVISVPGESEPTANANPGEPSVNVATIPPDSLTTLGMPVPDLGTNTPTDPLASTIPNDPSLNPATNPPVSDINTTLSPFLTQFHFTTQDADSAKVTNSEPSNDNTDSGSASPSKPITVIDPKPPGPSNSDTVVKPDPEETQTAKDPPPETEKPKPSPTDKPDDKPTDKPTDKPEDKPTDKPEDKPEDKPTSDVPPPPAVTTDKGNDDDKPSAKPEPTEEPSKDPVTNEPKPTPSPTREEEENTPEPTPETDESSTRRTKSTLLWTSYQTSVSKGRTVVNTIVETGVADLEDLSLGVHTAWFNQYVVLGTTILPVLLSCAMSN